MNYGYQEINLLTPEQILQKVTASEIFALVFKEPVQFGKMYISPFRPDRTPGCFFTSKEDGTIIFVDFGEKNRTGHTHRTCFRCIMDLHLSSLSEALDFISKEFNLSLNSNDYSPIVNVVNYESREVVDTEVTFIKKPFIKEDRLFWSQWLITPAQMESDRTHSVRSYTIKKYKVHIFNPYRYCYVFDFLDACKIFNPFGNPKYRWISSCDENDIGNYDNLPESGEELIIQKSYKDHRVVRNVDEMFNVIWFQNEGCIPDIHILKSLSQRFKLITIFFDNDLAGIQAARKLRDVFNLIRESSCRMIYLPRPQWQLSKHNMFLKDPGEFINKEGSKELVTVFKHIKLL